MSRIPRPVSEAYQPDDPNVIKDAFANDHYIGWGYSLAHETDADGQALPEGGNTAVFRIMPKGMTEPVFVTKPDEDATFTVSVIAGEGKFIRARTTGEVEEVELSEGTEVVIRPGDAYIYQNTGEASDLILRDVAVPAFERGDDVELTSSRLYYSNIPEEREGYKSCVTVAADHKLITIYLPEKFYELVGEAATVSEVLSDPYAGDLIVSSIRYSQGDKYLGARSLATIVSAHPERFLGGRISEGSIAAAVPIARHIRNNVHPEYASKAISGEASMTADEVEKAIREQLGLMADYSEELPETELPAIAGMMLQRDARFLLHHSPAAGVDKPGRLPNGQPHSMDTTFMSHYCYYGLAGGGPDGHKAGLEEYNELFADISSPEAIRALPSVKLVKRETGDGEAEIIRMVPFPMDQFERVLRVHFEHFPDDLDLIPEPKKAALREIISEATATALGL